MATTRQNLDIQSDKVLTEPTVQTRIIAKDLGATQALNVDWDEPVGADRTVTFQDPGADDAIAYLDAPQVFQNKQISTVPSVADDVANKDYVDTAITAAAPPTATSGVGGAVEGTVSADEALGLEITGGVMAVRIDGATMTFNGSGQLVASVPISDGTAGSGGGTKGILTADSDKGLDVVSGVLELKVDNVSVGINLAGELETVGAGAAAGPTGTVSQEPQFTENIASITPPTDSTTGAGDISTLDFPPSVITGTRFGFGVPEDYFDGDIVIQVIHQMDASDLAGSIEVTTQAKIVDVSAGIIDSASYPETQASLTVPTTTDVERRTMLTITNGDFFRGDSIEVLIKRLGNDVGDVNTADWKVLGFQYAYTAVVNGRVVTIVSKFFEDVSGETPTSPNTISSGDITVEDFPTAVDTGLKFEFTVPDNWDEVTGMDLRLTYVMSVSDIPGVVRIEPRAKIARIVGGTIDTIAPTMVDFTPGAGSAGVPKTTTTVLSIPASALSRGDAVTIVLVRRGTAGADTHTGDFQLLCASSTFGTVSTLGVNAVTIREEYTNQGVFGNVAGAGINTDTDYIDLTDFETYDRMEATVGAGSVDVSYQGRLGALGSTIKRISTFIKGTAASSYTFVVQAEGFGVVYTVGPIVVPVGATEIVLTDLDLSNQPAGSGRFVVIVSATFTGAAEELLVSRPFVRLE